ncbi:hypothetical protein U1Q18_022730 [Sarracenia purpurea var. burkii]
MGLDSEVAEMVSAVLGFFFPVGSAMVFSQGRGFGDGGTGFNGVFQERKDFGGWCFSPLSVGSAGSAAVRRRSEIRFMVAGKVFFFE